MTRYRPVKVRHECINIDATSALEGNGVLINDELVLGHVDETRTESLMNGAGDERGMVESRSRINRIQTILILMSASLQSSRRYLALRL
jgi:hypothetical protein